MSEALTSKMTIDEQDAQPTNIDIAIGSLTELIILARQSNALRCRVPGTTSELTLRTAVRDEVPGDIVTVVPTKEWTHRRHRYVAGAVTSSRSDVEALGLTPLALHNMGEWDPADEYWGEDDEPRDAWEQAIIAYGKRRSFEMEQVIPGADPEDFDSDPIIEASERNDAGDHAGARAVLMNLLAQDLRCLDAHAHLGNHELDYRPEQALRHYETGTAIGELSLGPRFRDALPWGLIDNRPYLRCLHGKGLALWRLGRMQDAAAIFQRLLWLNPSDHQGARFCLAAVEAGQAWEP
jgi:tetratricopeptide (TPR) repeat protein